MIFQMLQNVLIYEVILYAICFTKYKLLYMKKQKTIEGFNKQLEIENYSKQTIKNYLSTRHPIQSIK